MTAHDQSDLDQEGVDQSGAIARREPAAEA
jgi:hypothetical protein